MEMLILLTYSAICIVIFKLFKIPLNKWSIPTAGPGVTDKATIDE